MALDLNKGMTRKQKSIFISAIGLPLLVVFVWLSGNYSQSQRRDDKEPAISTLSSNKTASQIITAATKTMISNSPPAIANAISNTFAEQERQNKLREGLSVLNDQRIVLFGKVVDQFGAPVANATVFGNILVYNGSKEGEEKLQTMTDAYGYFNISGYKGERLGVNIVKTGYRLVATNAPLIYSYMYPKEQRHVHDPNNPVVFTLWKNQGAENLNRSNSASSVAKS
jgi:hypothetical protein